MSENKNCDSCNFCDSCNSCNFCNSCNSCNFCDSCNSCNFCNSCDSCNFCNSCNSCDFCNFCDSCNFCYGLKMSERMIFCLGEGKYASKGIGYQKNNMVFNTQVTSEEYDKIKSSIPNIKPPLTKWIEEKNMTYEEKEDNTSYKILGGYLRVNSYKDSWKEFWNNAEESVKKQIKEIPHFNAEIFEKITGIKIDEVKETIKIGNREYDKNEVEKALESIKSLN